MGPEELRHALLSSHFLEGFLFLGYLAIPLVAYLVYLLFKLFRRGKAAETEAENES